MIRLLQTLDEDGNPDNGITITETAKANAVQVNFFVPESEFEDNPDVDDLITNGGQTSETVVLVDAVDAIAHFEAQLADNGLTDDTIYGVWETQDGTVALILFDTWHLAVQWEQEDGFIGFERGTYSVNDSDISFTTIQNNDGDALFCHEVDTMSPCPDVTFGYSITNDVFSLSIPDYGTATFYRAIFSNDTIQGLWNLPGESVVFIFLPDGGYLAVQWEEENGFIGFERGTYEVNGESISFTTLQNNDGEALLCNEPSPVTCTDIELGFSILDDELTLNIPDEGLFTFERVF